MDPLVTGVDFVTGWTRDLPRAMAFYGDVLGLPRSATYSRGAGAEFEAGALTLQLLACAVIGRDFSPTTPIALRVADVAAARARLEAQGVAFVAAFDSGVCHQAVFNDPDGNVLVLHHRYAPREPTA